MAELNKMLELLPISAAIYRRKYGWLVYYSGTLSSYRTIEAKADTLEEALNKFTEQAKKVLKKG